MPRTHRTLVIAAVGDGSLHRSWIAGNGRRSFDLALIYYGDRGGNFREDADYYWEKKGFKYPLIADVLDAWGDSLESYDYIWAPDDDILAMRDEIHGLFQVVREHGLLIAQPAIGSGDVSYRSLRRQGGLRLRYTRFVEVMCPVFSRDALRVVRCTFRDTISGWGIDWAWTRLVDCRRLAVVDAVGVCHTRPLGSGEAYQGFAQRGVPPTGECRRVMRKYGLRGPLTRWRRRQLKYGTARCEAIDFAGRRVIAGPPWWKRFGRAA
jgi:hypothetical protein